jgi:hypothetical protein
VRPINPTAIIISIKLNPFWADKNFTLKFSFPFFETLASLPILCSSLPDARRFALLAFFPLSAAALAAEDISPDFYSPLPLKLLYLLGNNCNELLGLMLSNKITPSFL